MPKYEDQLDFKVVDRVEKTHIEESLDNGKSPFFYKSKRFKRDEEGDKIYDERGRAVQEEVIEARQKEVLDGVELLIKDVETGGTEWVEKEEAKGVVGNNWEVNQAERNYLDRQGMLNL